MLLFTKLTTRMCSLDYTIAAGNNNEFFGKSLDILRDLLLAEEREFKSNIYAKMIQSSGTGKSRLMDEIGKEFLSISFVLRHPDSRSRWVETFNFPPIMLPQYPQTLTIMRLRLSLLSRLALKQSSMRVLRLVLLVL